MTRPSVTIPVDPAEVIPLHDEVWLDADRGVTIYAVISGDGEDEVVVIAVPANFVNQILITTHSPVRADIVAKLRKEIAKREDPVPPLALLDLLEAP